MYKSQRLICCPHCKCSVRSDRLEKHLKKAHGLIEKGNGLSSNDRAIHTLVAQQNFEEVSRLVASYLKDKNISLKNISDAKIIATMAFETLLGYETEEIIGICYSKNQCAIYLSNANRLWPTFKRLIDPLYDLLAPYKKPLKIILPKKVKHKAKTSRKTSQKNEVNNANSSEENDFSSYMSWYDCNSVDPDDASKYIGYYQREYGGSRFGSFPIHDNYGEESWADGNPWE